MKEKTKIIQCAQTPIAWGL